MVKHFLTGEEYTATEIEKLLTQARYFKANRNKHERPLQGMFLALLFDKPSLRTRFSFAIAMSELGGAVVESVGNTRKTEAPEDQARVLSGYCHGIMIRTHDDLTLQKMQQYSSIPVINGLSDWHHPCQILADLMTLQERFATLNGLTLSYIGDGNNILHSLLLLLPQMGVTVHYCCPNKRGPNLNILSQAHKRSANAKIVEFNDPQQAVINANAVYTDVWTSMGFETQAQEHLFSGFQVNESLMKKANSDAVFMHCLPMERGKEVSNTLPEHACSVIFKQSENRLHVQKALLSNLLGGVRA